jgi:hypothetical protein
MDSEDFYLGWYTTNRIKRKVYMGEHGFVIADDYGLRLSVENRNYLILKMKGEEIANVLLEDVTKVE